MALTCAARAAAARLIAKSFPGHGIIVVGRVVYIDHGDDV